MELIYYDSITISKNFNKLSSINLKNDKLPLPLHFLSKRNQILK